MYGHARSVLGPTPPGLIVIVTLPERCETVAVMASPPSALASSPRQAADSGATRYQVSPGRNQVPKICASRGSVREAGRLSAAGAARGEDGVPA